MNEKSGAVSIGLKSGRYFLDLELAVPVVYPAKAVEIQSHKSNLPSETLSLFLLDARDTARRLAELPTTVEGAGRPTARDGAGTGKQSKSEMLSQTQTLATRNRVSALADGAAESQQKALERRRELEATFISQPSLFPVVEFLYDRCLCHWHPESVASATSSSCRVIRHWCPRFRGA